MEITGEVLFRRVKGNEGEDVNIGIGYLLAPQETFISTEKSDANIPIAWKDDKKGAKIGIIGDSQSPIFKGGDSEIGELLLNLEYPRGIPAGGSLIIRNTAISDGGKPVYILAIVSQNRNFKYDRTQIYNINGNSKHLAITPGDKKLPYEPNGMALSSLYKTAIWGEEEPWGFISTLRLDVLRLCAEYDDLMMKETHTQEDLKRFDEMKLMPFHGIINPTQDPNFKKFKNEMIKSGFKTNWLEKTTLSREKEFEEKAYQIVRQISG